jgi:hypothetical protein
VRETGNHFRAKIVRDNSASRRRHVDRDHDSPSRRRPASIPCAPTTTATDRTRATRTKPQPIVGGPASTLGLLRERVPGVFASRFQRRAVDRLLNVMAKRSIY